MPVSLILAVALVAAPGDPDGSKIVAGTPWFQARSGFWMNLHHVLFELGRRKVLAAPDLKGSAEIPLNLGELQPAELAAWNAAVDTYSRFSDRDLLFDEELGALRRALTAAEDAGEPAAGGPNPLLQAMKSVAPLYRRSLWLEHDAANRKWFSERDAEVAAVGAVIVETLERAFDAKFPPAPLAVDVVAVANWSGAYSSARSGMHTVVSSLDPRNQGRWGTEILFHEASHGMTEALERALGPTAPSGLWHAVLFYTVGEACRRPWPDHVPYAEREGLYRDAWAGYRNAIGQHWASRLDGQPALQIGADRLLRQLGAPDPDVAASRAQTVVTGTRTERRLEDAVVPTEVINRAQLEATGARTLEQLLLQQPGVEVEYSFRGAAVSLQGLGPEYVLVLIDGERQTGRVGNVLDLNRYSLRDVERIEIIKGPGAALYGSDAIGGVINLITRRPQKKFEVSGRLQGGLTQPPRSGIKADVIDGRVHAGTKLGWFEARTGFGYQAQAPFDFDPRDAATSGAGFTRWDVDLVLAANVVDKARVTAKVDYMRRDLNAVDLAPSGAVFDRRQRSEQFNLGLRFDVTPTDTTRISVWGKTALYRDQLQQDQRGAAQLDQYTASLDRIYTVDAQLDQRLNEHTLTVGGQFLKEALFSSRISQLADRYRVGLFVQDEWSLPDVGGGLKAKLLPGLRLDVDSQFGTAPTPRLAVKLDPLPQLSLRASYGWGFRAPSFQELYLLFENTSVGYVVKGNDKLRPETSQAINLSVDWRLPLEGWVASTSLFHTELVDLINIDTSAPIDPINPTLFRYGNVSSAYAQGLETSLRMRLSRGTYLDLGYVLTDAKDNVRRAALAGRSVHKVWAQLTARYRPTGLEAVVRATFLGPRPFYLDEDGDTREEQVWTRGMVNLDAQITWRPFTWGSVFAGVTNLLNAGDAVFVPQPPRRLIAGVQLEY